MNFVTGAQVLLFMNYVLCQIFNTEQTLSFGTNNHSKNINTKSEITHTKIGSSKISKKIK